MSASLYEMQAAPDLRELNELDQLLEQSSSLPGGRESRQERKDGAGKK